MARGLFARAWTTKFYLFHVGIFFSLSHHFLIHFIDACMWIRVLCLLLFFLAVSLTHAQIWKSRKFTCTQFHSWKSIFYCQINIDFRHQITQLPSCNTAHLMIYDEVNDFAGKLLKKAGIVCFDN